MKDCISNFINRDKFNKRKYKVRFRKNNKRKLKNVHLSQRLINRTKETYLNQNRVLRMINLLLNNHRAINWVNLKLK